MTRDDLIRQLRAEGLSQRKIAEQAGCSVTTVRRVLDPAYDERNKRSSREAKRQRTGTCRDCGAVTHYNGRGGASPRCVRCASIRNGTKRKRWTQEAIEAKIQQWERIYGRPPTMEDWNAHELTGHRLLRYQTGDWPGFSTVVRTFGTWNNAIQAAGLQPRPPHGPPKQPSSSTG